MEQKPTVGRIVHYFPTASEFHKNGPFAAIVTRVVDDRWVDLSIFPPGYGILSRDSIHQRAPGFTTGVWDWPERDAP